MTRRLLAVGVALGVALAPPAAAFQDGLAPGRVTLPHPTLDRYAVPLPPGYPRAPAGFVPLPGSLVPRETPGLASPHHDHRWVPGRSEVVVGVDAKGRITHILEYVPGHFAR